MDQQTTHYFKEEALPFIVYEPGTRQFVLTEEAKNFLGAVKGNIGLVAVAGLYRTGKSYLLNRMLLNRSNGFGVGPTINPCTKGLWIWGKPIPGETPDGEPINVLIVDTEGLGALDEDSNHDVRIFSLAILLSSYFIYNSVGSIDESALQNLSLVINLTKNIQIKSKVASGDESDLDEYGQYFPSFMWVVRDFTLQLVDEEGEPISSQAYLDKALEIQKGFSDAVEQKNRIRRLLTSFFKERDCCTMIRPLTNEENLQNLSSLDLEELRPDFVEQVLILRRKVISKVKPKTLNGKKLSGEMLATLAESYVAAINKGAVPNIESAWSYICKSECQKALNEALKYAEDSLGTITLPMDEHELAILSKEVKKNAKTIFNIKSIGQQVDADEYLKQLKAQMIKLITSVKEENERVSHQACIQFLQESYSFIDSKLRNREFVGGFQEYYETDMRSFQQYFIEHGPPGPNRQLILADFSQRAVAEAAEYFGRSIQSELELQKQILCEEHKRLEAQLKEVKADYNKERDMLETRLRTADIEKAEFQAIQITQKERLERLEFDKSIAEQELRDQLSQQKADFQREIEECRSKMQKSEQLASDLQRKLIQSESETDKGKALLEQEIEYLKKTIVDLQKKEADYQSEVKTLQKDNMQIIHQQQQKYELRIKDLTLKLDESQEQLLDTKSLLESIEQKFGFEKQQWQQQQETLKGTMNVSQAQFTEVQRALDDVKSNSRKEIERLRSELAEVQDQFKMREMELEEALKDKEEDLKSQKNHSEKDLAIIKQNLQFKEVQNQQLRAQIEESKKSHEQLLSAMEGKQREQSDGKESAIKQVNELKAAHIQEIKELEAQYSESRQILENKLEQLNERYSDLELKFKLLQTEHQQMTQQLQSQVDSLEDQRKRSMEQSKSSESHKLRIFEETEHRYQLTIAQLEQELEDRETRASNELRDLQMKSEEALKQLKNFYEEEKERVEHRLIEERERANKKLAQQHEEFEQRLKDEQNQHEEDNQLLTDELTEIKMQFQAFQAQVEHEAALMQQKLETQEAYIREKDERLAKEQSQTSSQMEAQLERFNAERKGLFARVEQLNSALTTKDRELTMAKNRVEAITEEVERRKKQLEEQRIETTNERVKLNEKIEQLRQKNQEMADDHMQRKLEDGRELALYKQQLEFNKKTIEDLQRTCDQQYTKFEERCQAQKQEYQTEIQEVSQKYNQQREQLEAKYETKRRQFKEQEQTFLRQIAELNKERAVLEEKLSSFDLKTADQICKYENEILGLRDQLVAINESLSRERETFMGENDKLRKTVQEQEHELSELSATYEREKELWKGEKNFFLQQKEQAKSDLADTIKKYEMTLEQMKNHGSAEKDRNESLHHTLLSTIESKFKAQIKDQQEQAARDKLDLTEKLRNLEKENRTLLNRLQIEQRDKANEQGSLQKKVQELMESENRMQKEIDSLKEERDRRLSESQKSMDKERELLRIKIQEAEQRQKEAETRRSTQIFEFEKERARWTLERDHFISQKQEIQETVERLQRKTEDLLKENEKLKSDRSLRKQQYIAGGYSNPATASKFGVGGFGQHMVSNRGGPGSVYSKENAATPGGIVSSQIFPASGLAKFMQNNASTGESSTPNEKPDPHTLPFAMRENHSYLPHSNSGSSFAHNIRARLGSPSGHQQQPLTQLHLQQQAAQMTGAKHSFGIGGIGFSSGPLSVSNGSNKSGNGGAGINMAAANTTGTEGPASTDSN